MSDSGSSPGTTENVGEDTASAARLAQRASPELARFIVSLQHAPGALGEHVQTFLLGDDTAACSASIEARLARLRAASNRTHQQSSAVGQVLDFLLDDIETLVLPIDARQTLRLLVQFIECDGPAAEHSVHEDDEVQQAFKRAITLLARVAAGRPTEERDWAAARLLTSDDYGLRIGVREALE